VADTHKSQVRPQGAYGAIHQIFKYLKYFSPCYQLDILVPKVRYFSTTVRGASQLISLAACLDVAPLAIQV
jgi:hypothetical protein